MRLHNRLIKADLWTSTDLIRTLGDPLGLQLYQGMIQIADDAGCLLDDELAWKILLFPGFDIDMSKLRKYADALIEADKLVAYECDGKKYLWLKNFHKHQSLDYPCPPEYPLPDWIEWCPGEKRHQSCYRIYKTLCPVRISEDTRRGFEIVNEDVTEHSTAEQCLSDDCQCQDSVKTVLRHCQSNDKTVNSLSYSNSIEKKKGCGEEEKQNGEQRHCLDNDIDDVSAIMEHYNRVFDGLWAKPLKLTKDRRQKIRARLKLFNCEELCGAINNIRTSSFHCGENDAGKVYATPEFIFRNDGQVDKWLKAKPVSRDRADPCSSRYIPDVEESMEYLNRLREEDE